MGHQRGGPRGGRRDKRFGWRKRNGPQRRPGDVTGLAKCQGSTALPTNANTPSSYCLDRSQNHSFPVCFLVTGTIRSFKNSLPYILQQTVPNLCFRPDALTDKLLAGCILNFSRELDLKNKWIMLSQFRAKFLGDNREADEVTAHPRQPLAEKIESPQEVAPSSETDSNSSRSASNTCSRSLASSCLDYSLAKHRI